MIVGFGAILIFMAWIIGWITGKDVFSDDGEENLTVGVLAYAALLSLSLTFLYLLKQYQI